MIILDYQDRRPIYEQITERFRTLIYQGALPAGSRLPSVRQLAMELSINPNTIQRAYMTLEQEGLIYPVRGKGNFVAEMYSIRITVNSIRNDGTTRKDPGNGGKPRKIKGFSELMKRGGTRIDTFFEKRAHFSEQKEKLSTLSTKRAGKPHKQRVPGSFLNWNE